MDVRHNWNLFEIDGDVAQKMQIIEALAQRLMRLVDLAELAERMQKSVSFRNLAVHNYEAINWVIVYAVATQHLDDFKAFAAVVLVIAWEQYQ